MADELPEVTQRFEADMAEYLESLDRGADDAQKFADANREASGAVDGMRDHAAEAGGALDDLATQTAGAAREDGSLRDQAIEAAEALGHLRDNALEAAAAVKHLDDQTGSVKTKIDSLKNDVEQESSKGGLLGKLMGGAGDVWSKIPMLGEMGPALVAVIPVVYSLLAEVTALAGGFAAAGAGAAAFGILAMPAFKAVTGAYTQINKDQQAYDNALTKTGKNAALKKLKKDYEDLDPAERGAVKGIQGLMGTYHQMAKAFEPDAFKIFNDGLKVANNLLPSLTPLATSFANSLDGLLKHLDKFTKSKDFKDWMKQFEGLVGPAVTAIGNGLGKLGPALGKLLTTMSKKDVVNAINIAFAILVGTLNAVVFVVKKLMSDWDQYSSAFRRVRHDIASGAHEIAGDFDSMRHTIASWGHNTASIFDKARHDVADFAHNVAAHFDEARHDVATWAHDAASLFDSVRHTVASWGHDIANTFDTVRHKIASWVDDVKTDTGKVISWFKSLPGKILSALGNLGSLLWNAGKSLIDGLINGVQAAIGHLKSVLSGITSLIPSWKGPLAVDRMLLYENGQAVMQGFMNGVASHVPALRSQLGSITNAIPGLTAGHGGAAGATGAPVHVTVPITLSGSASALATPQFMQGLQQVVQEAILRYTQVNPSNGLSLAGKLA